MVRCCPEGGAEQTCRLWADRDLWTLGSGRVLLLRRLEESSLGEPVGVVVSASPPAVVATEAITGLLFEDLTACF